MGSAEVTSRVEELTTPPTGGSTFVYGVVLPAEKGSYEPQTITGINALKNRYTAKGVFSPTTDKALYGAKKYCDIGSVNMLCVRPNLGENFGGLKCKSVSNILTCNPMSKRGTTLASGATFSLASKGYIRKDSAALPETIDASWLTSHCIEITTGLEIQQAINYHSSLVLAKDTKLFFATDPNTVELEDAETFPAFYGVTLHEDLTATSSIFGWFKNSALGTTSFGYCSYNELGQIELDEAVTIDTDNFYTVAHDIASVDTSFWTLVGGELQLSSPVNTLKLILVTETFENIIEQYNFLPLKDAGEAYAIGETLYLENIPYICKRITTVPTTATQSWVTNNFNPVGLSISQTLGLIAWNIGRTTMNDYEFDSDEVMAFYGANGGTWTNGLSISITNYLDSPKEISIPEAFQVRVYYYGILKDTFLCSRVQGILDANGESIYVEDVINNRSLDLRVKDNTLIAADINPATQLTPVNFFGGSVGRALNDDDMILALNKLSNEAKYPITLLGNGGYSTLNYAKALHTFITARRSGVVAFSLPLSSALSADPITSYVDFVDQTGISDGRFWFEEFWSKERDADTGRDVMIPPDGLEAFIYAKLVNDVGLYHAPAGWENAVVSVTPLNEWDKPSRDILDLNKINFFKKSNLGLCVFSEATSLVRASYLQQKHIVIALYDLIPKVEDACEPFLYQLADVGTYLRITKTLEPIIDLFVMNKGAATNPPPAITCNTTNNSQAMRDAQEGAVWIEYTPLNSIKRIQVTFGLTNGSVTLADVREV